MFIRQINYVCALIFRDRGRDPEPEGANRLCRAQRPHAGGGREVPQTGGRERRDAEGYHRGESYRELHFSTKE